MSNDILVITENLENNIADISYEMVGKAKELAASAGGKVIAVVMGSGMGDAANSFASDTTIYVDDAVLANFNPEAFGKVVENLISDKSPRVVMLGYTSMGMDIAAWLSAKIGAPCISFVNALSVDGDAVVATSQLYGGKMAAEVTSSADVTIATVLAGSFPADDGKGSTSAEQITSPVALDDLKTTFIKLLKPEAGDVDIAAQDKLVSVGRGIGSEDGIEMAQELADVLKAEVSASRPITDAGWLPKTRQVGKSGVSVKPKLYFMLGISGAPEHLEGMKDAELIIAINTDENAPIFDIAHYGSTEDLYDVAEAMLEMLE